MHTIIGMLVYQQWGILIPATTAPITVDAYAQNLKKFPRADATACPLPRAPGRSEPGA